MHWKPRRRVIPNIGGIQEKKRTRVLQHFSFAYFLSNTFTYVRQYIQPFHKSIWFTTHFLCFVDGQRSLFKVTQKQSWSLSYIVHRLHAIFTKQAFVLRVIWWWNKRDTSCAIKPYLKRNLSRQNKNAPNRSKHCVFELQFNAKTSEICFDQINVKYSATDKSSQDPTSIHKKLKKVPDVKATQKEDCVYTRASEGN